MGEGKVDLAFRLGALVEPGLGARRLGEIDFWLVASPAYLATRPHVVTPAELAGHDLVTLFPRQPGDRLVLYHNGVTRTAAWTPSLIIDDPEAIRRAVIAGAGLASLPAFLVHEDVMAERLERVLPDWTGETTTVSAVYDSGRPPPLRLTAFLDFLLESFGASPPWGTPATT
jgi:DNA-binding transcriptional LysR family regulator